MGITTGLCGVDEFHDEVSGLCGHCADICRNIAKPDSFCIYHCADYYSRLLSTTAISLQEGKPQTSLILISVLLFVIICMTVIIMVMTYRHIHILKRKQNKFPDRRNTERQFAVAKFRHRRQRVNRHNSVQETRDPNKQEDMQLSALYISPCSSLVLGSDSATEGGIRFQSSAHGVNSLDLNRGGLKHLIKTDAIVYAEDTSFCSDFEETQLKIPFYTEDAFFSLNKQGSGESVTKLNNFEGTRIFKTNNVHPRLDSEDDFDVVDDSRLYFRPGEHGNSEVSITPVQEVCTFTSSKGVHNESDDKSLRAPFQESYLAASKGGPS